MLGNLPETAVIILNRKKHAKKLTEKFPRLVSKALEKNERAS